jgi:hypothetical protein
LSVRGGFAGRCEALALVGAVALSVSFHPDHRFEQARALAGGASAWFRQPVRSKQEIAVLAPRWDDFDLMTGRSRRSKRVLEISFHVAARGAQFSGQ